VFLKFSIYILLVDFPFLFLSLSPTNSHGMYFFIVTDSIQMKGAHNLVVPLIAIFHGCSSTDRIQFSWDDTIFIF